MRSLAVILQATGMLSVALGLGLAIWVERNFGEAITTIGLMVLIAGLLVERGW